MKSNKTYRILAALLLVFPASLSAQSDEDCLKQIRAIYMKVNDLPSQRKADKKIYHLNYTVKTVMRDSSQPATSATVDAIVGSSRSCYVTDQMKVYQDESNTVTVIPIRKMIYVTDSDGKQSQGAKSEYFSFMQDTLFDMAKVESCSDRKTVQGKTIRKVKFSLNETAREVFKARTIVFEFDPAEKTIHKTVIYYTTDSQIASAEITYNDTSYDYKTSKLNRKATSHVFASSGRLLAKYEGFTVYDVRKSQQQTTSN